MEKENFLLAAIESGLQVWKCDGCGELAITQPGVGKVMGACPNCETSRLIVPIAVTYYSPKIQN